MRQINGEIRCERFSPISNTAFNGIVAGNRLSHSNYEHKLCVPVLIVIMHRSLIPKPVITETACSNQLHERHPSHREAGAHITDGEILNMKSI